MQENVSDIIRRFSQVTEDESESSMTQVWRVFNEFVTDGWNQRDKNKSASSWQVKMFPAGLFWFPSMNWRWGFNEGGGTDVTGPQRAADRKPLNMNWMCSAACEVIVKCNL